MILRQPGSTFEYESESDPGVKVRLRVPTYAESQAIFDAFESFTEGKGKTGKRALDLMKVGGAFIESVECEGVVFEVAPGGSLTDEGLSILMQDFNFFAGAIGSLLGLKPDEAKNSQS